MEAVSQSYESIMSMPASRRYRMLVRKKKVEEKRAADQKAANARRR